MTHLRYVAIEGLVGTGKTTLAKRLAAHWKADLLLESPESNPFLPRFYQNMRHYAFTAQVRFLLERAEHCRRLLSGEMATPVVADYLFDKDALFARLNLDDDEMPLYRALQQKFLPEHPLPDLVIMLQASPEVAARRIAARGNAYEFNFPDGYLRRLETVYNDFFHHYDAAPVLAVNTDNLNLAESDEDFEWLLRCIADMRGTRSYFNKSA